MKHRLIAAIVKPERDFGFLAGVQHLPAASIDNRSPSDERALLSSVLCFDGYGSLQQRKPVE